MPEKVMPGPVEDSCGIREAVCIHTRKIFDSCRDKDCIEDLRFYPKLQCVDIINRALSVKGGSAKLLYVYVDVEPKNGENLSKGYDYTITDGDVKDMYVGTEEETYDGVKFDYKQTLGYKNFDLVYRTDTETIYGRPATTWGTGTYNVKTEAGSTSKTDNLTENGGLIASKVRMLDKDEIITVPTPPPTPILPARTSTRSTRTWASLCAPCATMPRTRATPGLPMSTARKIRTWMTTSPPPRTTPPGSTPARAPSPRSTLTTPTPL